MACRDGKADAIEPFRVLLDGTHLFCDIIAICGSPLLDGDKHIVLAFLRFCWHLSGVTQRIAANANERSVRETKWT